MDDTKRMCGKKDLFTLLWGAWHFIYIFLLYFLIFYVSSKAYLTTLYLISPSVKQDVVEPGLSISILPYSIVKDP